MKVIVESLNNINVTMLPEKISGSYWILDNNSKNLLNVIEEEGKWILKSNEDIKISANIIKKDLNGIDFKESEILEINKIYYVINISTKEKYILYTLPSYENFENLVIDWTKSNNVIIGRENNCDICVNNILFLGQQLSINFIKENNGIFLKNLNVNSMLFVNNSLCNETYLQTGDSIFIGGLIIYCFGLFKRL